MPGRAGRGARLVIRMVSSSNTGFTYYTTKNPRKMQHKLKLMKYDPVVRQHVLFSEAKIKR